MTKDEIVHALSHVEDPDLKKDLVTLNMIEDIQIEGNKVSFKVVLTTPACPLKNEIKQACVASIHDHLGEDVEVEIEMTSRVTTGRGEQGQMLKDVKNIIAVGSGKGGVGKSTMAVNLAVALAKSGAKVGLLDADIYGPSIPVMFGLTDQQPLAVEKDGQTRIVPFERFGVKILSIGFFVDQSKAIIWRGPMASTALKQLMNDTDWGALDYMVIDLPPGTGDIPLTLIQEFPITGSIIVSTPQDVAIADVRKAASMFRNEQLRIPLLGMVENMSYFVPEDAPDKKYYIFGKSKCKKFADENNIMVLGEIPIVPEISESGDNGNPIATDPNAPVTKAFDDFAEKVAQQIAIQNAIKESFGIN